MTTLMSEIDKEINSFLAKARNETIKMLSNLGDLCVIEARDRPEDISWYNKSGNLRSSVGFVIAEDGVIIKSSGFSGSQQGASEGKEFAIEVATRQKSGYILVVVAGMNYASFVEDRDNKCVLASAELLARKKLPYMMSQLNQKLVV